MEKLKYGLLGDKLVHIDDVEKGLACNCICPYCKTQLVAKKGNHNAKHFAHYKLADCNHGTETALHIMAKNIIAQTRKVFVPYLPKSEYDLSNNGKIMLFEKAILEKQLSNNIRGDIVLYSGNSFLNVEIKVTHEVDLKKQIELFNTGIPTIEIDLTNIKSNFNKEIVEQQLVNAERVHLINSPKKKEIFAKWILGEWKEVYNSGYVKDCPCSRKKAYFVDIYRKGGNAECHECAAFMSFAEYGDNSDKLLCFGKLDMIDFNKIDKILFLVKEENHIRNVKLLMNDGIIIEE